MQLGGAPLLALGSPPPPLELASITPGCTSLRSVGDHECDHRVLRGSVLAGMLAGADSIEDRDVLRSGAAPRLFDDLRAPSTVGSWLRGFTCGHVRQLDALSRALRVRLWAAGAGPKQLAGPLIVDVDSTVCPTYGPVLASRLTLLAPHHRPMTQEIGFKSHPLSTMRIPTVVPVTPNS